MADRLYESDRPEDPLDTSFRVGNVRIDCFHGGDKRFTVCIDRDELDHGDVVCAIQALKRAEKYIAAHCSND
jgi:hypothetical protein